MDSEKRLRINKSSAMMACMACRVDKAPAKTHGMRVKTLSDHPFPPKMRFYTAFDANWLNNISIVERFIFICAIYYPHRHCSFVEIFKENADQSRLPIRQLLLTKCGHLDLTSRNIVNVNDRYNQ